MTQPAFTSARYLAVNATITTVCRTLGVASGIALDAVIVGLFGLSGQTDAYFAALAIPFLIAATVEIHGPTLLVPFFAQAFENNGRRETWVQLRNVMAAGGLLFFAIAAALTAGAWLMMPLQVPGSNPETVRLAIQLHMILAWIVLIQGLSAFVAGALYADHHYLVTTTSRMTTNVVTITVVVLGHARFGIHALAMGLLIGSTTQLVCLVCAAVSRGFRFGPAKIRDPGVTRLLRLGIYLVLGQTLSETRVLLENFLGSLVGPGAVSAVRYANRVIAAGAGMLVGGLVTTSLPIVSHYAAAGRFQEMKDALLKTIRFIALLAVPASLWLIFAGEAMVALTFERGQFTSADTARLSLLLALLTPYILFSRVTNVAEVAFYATMDMRTPLWGIPAFLITYIILCSLLLPSLGVFAFAIATSVGAIVVAFLMIRLVEGRFGPLPWADSRQFGRRLAIVTATTIAGFLVGSAANSFIVDHGALAKLVRALVVTVPGLAAFLGSAFLVRLVNWQRMLHIMRQLPPSKTVADAPA